MSKVDRPVQLRLYPNGSNVKLSWYLQYRIDPTELKWYQKIFSGWSRACGLSEYDGCTIYFTYSGDNPEEYLKHLQTHIKSENDLYLWITQQMEVYGKSHPNTRIIY
jgi:hypothetical protein